MYCKRLWTHSSVQMNNIKHCIAQKSEKISEIKHVILLFQNLILLKNLKFTKNWLWFFLANELKYSHDPLKHLVNLLSFFSDSSQTAYLEFKHFLNFFSKIRFEFLKLITDFISFPVRYQLPRYRRRIVVLENVRKKFYRVFFFKMIFST